MNLNPKNQAPFNLIRVLSLALSMFGLVLALILLNSPVSAQSQGAVKLELLESNSDRIVVELQVSNYAVRLQKVNGKTFAVVTVPGMDEGGLPGVPQLPLKGTMLGLPPGAQVSMQILADDSRRETLTAPILPVPTSSGQTDPRTGAVLNVVESYIQDPKIYAANQLYPSNVASLPSVNDWRSQRVALLEFHPFQYNPVTGQLVFHSRIRVQINLTYPRGKSAVAIGGAVKEGAFESVFQQNLLNYNSASNWRAPTRTSTAPVRQPTPYSGGPWYKIGVNSDGMYKVTCQQLADHGVNLNTLNITTLRVLKQSTELAINVVGSNWASCDSTKYLEFFGQAPDSKYTNTNIYWLTFGGVTGKRMASSPGGGVNAKSSFTDTIHLEQNNRYLTLTPWVENADHWFWTILYMPSQFATANATYSFRVQDPVNSGTASLQSVFSGYDGIHLLDIAVNGHLVVGAASWQDRTVYTASTTFPAAYLYDGIVNADGTISGTITVTGTNTYNTYADGIYVNSFDLRYQRAFTATNDILRMFQVDAGSWQYQVHGFTNPQIEMYDITDPYSVTRVATATVSAGALYTLQANEVISTPHQYLALTSAQVQSPASFVADVPSDLHGLISPNRADYIIIAYGAFTPSLQSLVTLRQNQGLSVKLVDVQDVYDEFSDGLVDPQAIRDFLQYTYDHWQSPKPSYVLLVGDGHIDPKEYCVSNGNCNLATIPNATFIPPYLRMVDPWGGETDSDNRFVAFGDITNTNTMPYMMIGRFPVNSLAEVDAMVAKTQDNELSAPTGAWRSNFTFVTDNAYVPDGASWKLDGAGNFWGFSDEVVSSTQYILPEWTAERIYFNPCPSSFSPDGGVTHPCNLPYTSYSDINVANSAVLSAINTGSMIVNYIGHGSTVMWNWDNGTLFQRANVSTLSNSGKYSVFLDMSCLTGYFIYSSSPSLQEVNVRTAGKGALASWASTGQGLAEGHDYLDKGFFDALAQQGQRRLGVLTMAGLSYLWTNAGGAHHDLMDTFVVFGDPAALLQVPNLSTYKIYLPFIRK